MGNNWYYGYLKYSGEEMFKSRRRPTPETDGREYHTVLGPFLTKKEAVREADSHKKKKRVVYTIVGYICDGETYCPYHSSSKGQPILPEDRWDHQPTCQICGRRLNVSVEKESTSQRS